MSSDNAPCLVSHGDESNIAIDSICNKIARTDIATDCVISILKVRPFSPVDRGDVITSLRMIHPAQENDFPVCALVDFGSVTLLNISLVCYHGS